MSITQAQALIDKAYLAGFISREEASKVGCAIRQASWLGMPMNAIRRAAMLRSMFGISA